jgi:hypothetical protein
MHDTREDVLVALRSTPLVLEQMVRSSAARQPTNGWNRAEIIWHLREAEARGLERMRAMRDGADPFLPAYDQAALAREGRYAERVVSDGLRQFAELRATMVDELERLSPEQWERTGRHQEVGSITILNQAIHLAGHDLNHLAQLARLSTPAQVA